MATVPNVTSPRLYDEKGEIVRLDERRLQLAALRYYEALRGVEALAPMESFAPNGDDRIHSHGIMLDLSLNAEQPAVQWIGAEIASQCGVADDDTALPERVPQSLLDVLTAHLDGVRTTKDPLAFEAAFTAADGRKIPTRGVLLPFTSDGDQVDFVYGVMNWFTGTAAARSPDHTIEAAPQSGDSVTPRRDGASDLHLVPALTNPEPHSGTDELDRQAALIRLHLAEQNEKAGRAHERESRPTPAPPSANALNSSAQHPSQMAAIAGQIAAALETSAPTASDLSALLGVIELVGSVIARQYEAKLKEEDAAKSAGQAENDVPLQLPRLRNRVAESSSATSAAA